MSAGTKTPLFVKKQSGGMFSITDESFTTGNRWFVGSTVTGATDGAGYGQNPDTPCATVDYAIGLATASVGDVIYVMPGHVETLAAAAGWAVDKIGVSIIGLGNGSNKPTITLGTDTDCDINVSVAGVKIKNINFASAINSLKNFLDLDAGDFECEGCKFTTASTLEAVTFVDIATTYDNFKFKNCEFYQPTDPEGTDAAAGTGCFYFVDSENIFVENCHFYGNFESAIFHNKTTAATGLWVKNCTGYQALSGGEIYIQVADMVGGEKDCLWTVPANADLTETAFVGTASAKWFSQNSGYGNDSAGGAAGAALLTACS